MEGMSGGGQMQMNSTEMHHRRHKMMSMHMTFFWGKNAEILFSGWPGESSGMYALALVLVFAASVAVEWLSHCRLIRGGSGGSDPSAAAGLAQTAMHAVRVGLGYMVMLAVMSFNVGVFLTAVAGHAVGFLLFGSRAFRTTPSEMVPLPAYEEKGRDLPPVSC